MRTRTVLLVTALSACLPPPPNRVREERAREAREKNAAATTSASPSPPRSGAPLATGSSPSPASANTPSIASSPAADAGSALAAPVYAPDGGGAGFTFLAGSPREFFAHDNDALARYLQQEHTPGWGTHADVTAGAADEWIMDVFQYAVVLSPDLSGFWYRDYGKSDVEGVAAVPLTRTDKKDVVVRTWVNEGELRTGYRHLVMEVWSFGPEGPILRFAQEISVWAMCCGSEANAPPRMSTVVSFHDGAIDLRAEPPWRVDARWKPGAVAPLMQSASSAAPLLPMLPRDVKRRLYTWDGRAFVLAREEKSG